MNQELNILKSSYYLNRAINECNIIIESCPNISDLILEYESDGPHYEWDLLNNKFYDRINNIESDIKKSVSYIKTAKEALIYLRKLINKINKLPNALKSRILKVAFASMFIFMSFQSIVDFRNDVNNSEIIDKNVVIDAMDNQIKKIKSKKEEFNLPSTYSSELINTLKKHEGVGLTAYNIGDGAYTIGYGHAVFKDVSRGDNSSRYPFLKSYSQYEKMKKNGEDLTITKSQAEQLFKDDLTLASKALNRLLNQWVEKDIKPKITQSMYDAMVSMIYNMGIKQFRLSEFIQLVKRGKFKEASEEIKNTSNQMFKKYPGLITRRNAESKLFTGNYST